MTRTLAARFALLALPFLLALHGCGPRDEEPAEGPPEPSPTEVQTRGGPKLPEPPPLTERARKLLGSGHEKMDGLEALPWKVESWSNPARAQRVSLDFQRKLEKGPYRLALELRGGDKETTALRCDGAWRLSVEKGAQTMLVIYNDTGAGMRFSLAYSCSDTYVWYETLAAVLKPGWNTLTVDQSASSFRAASCQWEPSAALWKPEDCRAIHLVFHNARRTGRFFVEYLGVEEQPETP